MTTRNEKVLFTLDARMGALEAEFRRASRLTRELSDKMERSFAGVRRAVLSLEGALGGIGLALGTREVIRTADEYRNLEGRLKLVTESSEELARVQKELFDLAQESRSEYAATVDLYARLARSTEHLGVSQEELLQVTEAVNKAIIVAGGTAQEASAGVIQFAQGLASGRLQGDELRSVLENMPRLAKVPVPQWN